MLPPRGQSVEQSARRWVEHLAQDVRFAPGFVNSPCGWRWGAAPAD
jgi:hypothetical protein